MSPKYFKRDLLEEIPPICGVYWLFEYNNDFFELVYIGQSINLRNRLKQHSKSYSFDYFTYEYYPERKLRKFEKQLLQDYFERMGHLPK